MSAGTLAIPERHATPAQAPAGPGVVRTLEDAFRLADVLIRSKMLPSSIQTVEAATAIILKGMELGIGAMHAFDSISVIQGKPTISPQLMLALIERTGMLADMTVEETANPLCCIITMTRRGRTPQVVSFDGDEARAMGLIGKDNWKKQPGVMCYWRAVAKACRRVFPDVIAGCYTPDEMGAEVGHDGEIVTATVVLDPDDGNLSHVEVARAPKAFHQNGSGHGQGSYPSPADEKRYGTFINKCIAKFNGDFAGKWVDPSGEVVAGMTDPINWHSVNNHMIRWVVEEGVGGLDPSIELHDLQTRQREQYNALAWLRERERFDAELVAYAKDKAVRHVRKWREKNPGLTPECLGFEELLEAEADDAASPPADDDGDIPAEFEEADPDAFEPGRE